MKKNYSTILLTLLLSMFCPKAFAYDFAMENDNGVMVYYNYINNGTELEVTYSGSYYYSGNSYSGEVIIPEEVTYMNITRIVTSIGEWAFYNCSSLTSITIPNSVTSIREHAFDDCSSLTSITIPNSVTNIGSSAFFECSSLTSITIPNSVTSIGAAAFNRCSSLTSITIPNSVTSIEQAVFAECSSLTSITIPNSVTSIGENSFMYCSSLTSVTIGNSVTNIVNNAFAYCSSLTSVTIGNSVTSIGIGAFEGCSSLTSITIPNSVTSIGDRAFEGCSSLTSVTIGNSVTTIGDWAFDGCNNLTKFFYLPANKPTGAFYTGNICYVPNSQYGNSIYIVVNPYLNYMFENGGVIYVPTSMSDRTCVAVDCVYNNSVKDIVIPETVTYRGITFAVKAVNKYAFYKNTNIENLTLLFEGTIEDNTFTGCTNLKTLSIGDGIESIGPSAFSGCTSLNKATLGDGLQSIGNYSFSGCNSLETIILGSSLQSIGIEAFSGCSAVTSLVSKNTVPPTCGSNALSSIDIWDCTLKVPEGSKELYQAAPQWQDFFFIEEGISEEEEETPTEVTVSIGSLGMATFCSPYALDFSAVDGLKAYIVSAFSPATGSAILTKVNKRLPARTGLILMGNEGSYTVPTTEADTYVSNMLVGVTTETVLSRETGSYTNYILANGSNGLGFYTVSNGSTLAAGKAYLPLPTAFLSMLAGARISLVFDDAETTGIDDLNQDTQDQPAIYNLNGQRLRQPVKGMYIMNGKTFIKR